MNGLTAPVGAFELKYIGAWRELRDEEYADLGGGAGSTTYRLDSHVYDGPAAIEANGGPTPLVIPTVTQEQMSHELQFSGKLFDDSVEFIVGGYAFEESGREDRLAAIAHRAVQHREVVALPAGEGHRDRHAGAVGHLQYQAGGVAQRRATVKRFRCAAIGGS